MDENYVIDIEAAKKSFNKEQDTNYRALISFLADIAANYSSNKEIDKD